jgi:hypothetical protein
VADNGEEEQAKFDHASDVEAAESNGDDAEEEVSKQARADSPQDVELIQEAEAVEAEISGAVEEETAEAGKDNKEVTEEEGDDEYDELFEE